MNTRIVTVAGGPADGKNIREAGDIIKAGGLVAFPTETVYGLGGDALSAASAARIYEAKGRPSDNPLIIHICRMEDLQKIAETIPQTAYTLAREFWPGSLTMIFRKADCVPMETTGGLDTVAVRMPAHETALALIEAAGGFVAAPSANLSGRPSPTAARYVIEDMNGRIDMILDGGESEFGLESTILDMTEKIPVILRPGYITASMLKEILGEVAGEGAMSLPEEQEPPRAPGMRYRHYAPKGSLTIVEGKEERVVSYINEQIEQEKAKGRKTGVIGTDQTAGLYHADSIKNAGSRNEERTIARQLYRILREFDEEGVSSIYSEAFDATGVGQAIMNRLLKAAGYRIITLK